MVERTVGYIAGGRQAAIDEAIRLVKRSNKAALLIICNDSPGEHTGGEDCFCKPLLVELKPEDFI